MAKLYGKCFLKSSWDFVILFNSTMFILEDPQPKISGSMMGTVHLTIHVILKDVKGVCL